VLAKVLGSRSGFEGLDLTLGKRREGAEWPYSGAIKVADQFGNKLVDKDVDEIQIDYSANVVTNPA
jgi:hypothetical protein